MCVCIYIYIYIPIYIGIDTTIETTRLYMKLNNTHVSLRSFVLLFHLSRLGLYIYQEGVYPDSCRLVQSGNLQKEMDCV